MNIDITARHFTASEQLKELVHEKIKKVELKTKESIKKPELKAKKSSPVKKKAMSKKKPLTTKKK